MGIKKKWVPGGTCCCLPQSSDGNIYSDTFDSLDADWTESQSETTFDVSGGYGILNQTVGYSGFSARVSQPTVTVGSMTDLLMIVEANAYRLAGTATIGVYVRSWAAGTGIYFGLNMRATSAAPNEINAIFHGSNNFIAYTPTDGDKLAIKFKYNAVTTNVDVCYFVDEELVYQGATSSAHFSDPTDYGLYATAGAGGGGFPKDIAKWDNFSFHLSH